MFHNTKRCQESFSTIGPSTTLQRLNAQDLMRLKATEREIVRKIWKSSTGSLPLISKVTRMSQCKCSARERWARFGAGSLSLALRLCCVCIQADLACVRAHCVQSPQLLSLSRHRSHNPPPLYTGSCRMRTFEKDWVVRHYKHC